MKSRIAASPTGYSTTFHEKTLEKTPGIFESAPEMNVSAQLSKIDGAEREAADRALTKGALMICGPEAKNLGVNAVLIN